MTNLLKRSVTVPKIFFKRTKEYKTSDYEKGFLHLEVLQMFSKNKKISEIAKIIHKKFPTKFKDLNEAIEFTGDLSAKYSK